MSATVPTIKFPPKSMWWVLFHIGTSLSKYYLTFAATRAYRGPVGTHLGRYLSSTWYCTWYYKISPRLEISATGPAFL